jgi:site-specific DNA-methyltransferase (adenine-specific)
MMKPYFDDGLVTLYHGDALEVSEWLTADVLVTDPPYGIAYKSGGMSNATVPIQDDIANDDTISVRDDVLTLWGDAKPGLVFGSWKIERPANTRHRLIWYKQNALPGMRATPWFNADEEIYVLGNGFVGKPEQNVLVTTLRQDGAYGEVAKYGHPTPKPVSLMEKLISKCPVGVVADPFAGSGATLVAARNLGRKVIGVELEEKYCELIANRLSQQVFDFGSLDA